MRAYLTLSAVIFCGFVGIGSASPFQTLYAPLAAALGFRLLYALAAFAVAGAAVYARSAVTRRG